MMSYAIADVCKNILTFNGNTLTKCLLITSSRLMPSIFSPELPTMQNYKNQCLQNTNVTKFHGSGYRSTSGPSYLKTCSSAACYVTVTHDKYAVDCSRLDRNILTLNLNQNPKP